MHMLSGKLPLSILPLTGNSKRFPENENRSGNQNYNDIPSFFLCTQKLLKSKDCAVDLVSCVSSKAQSNFRIEKGWIPSRVCAGIDQCKPSIALTLEESSLGGFSSTVKTYSNIQKISSHFKEHVSHIFPAYLPSSNGQLLQIYNLNRYYLGFPEKLPNASLLEDI